MLCTAAARWLSDGYHHFRRSLHPPVAHTSESTSRLVVAVQESKKEQTSRVNARNNAPTLWSPELRTETIGYVAGCQDSTNPEPEEEDHAVHNGPPCAKEGASLGGRELVARVPSGWESSCEDRGV